MIKNGTNKKHLIDHFKGMGYLRMKKILEIIK
jgi:hypothetical protein